MKTRCLQQICLPIWFYPILCLPFPARWWAKTDRYTGTASATIICARKELCIVNYSYRDCSSHETPKGQVHYLNLEYLYVQWKRWQVKQFIEIGTEITLKPHTSRFMSNKLIWSGWFSVRTTQITYYRTTFRKLAARGKIRHLLLVLFWFQVCINKITNDKN